MTASAPAPAGWRPDPSEPRSLRYWDGAGWTPHTATAEVATTRDEVAAETTAHLTAVLPESVAEHTTLPLAPGATRTRATVATRRLALAGTLTAGVSLAVACAALGLALAG
ncbi:DUF2510 domain-containing protein [Agromyces sp. SYSU T00266]|uniref:DUF2510 domain-containing protein n=1 Tax=Agromyces zhanjiangensis TaxID=3158562 RepID=UPI003392F9E5